jgi:transcriptional regulator with XRE-family HTH domain
MWMRALQIRLAVFYYRVRCAHILWRQRRRAGLGLDEAAAKARITSAALKRYELGQVSPPLCIISALLTAYKAEESAIMAFCMMPVPVRGLGWWLKPAFPRRSPMRTPPTEVGQQRRYE